MENAAKNACKPILTVLDGEVRLGIEQRIDAMVRELAFLDQINDERLALLRSAGWKNEHLHVLFFLNSLYQRVLGPQAAAARKGPKGLGADVAVHHGSTVFDANSAKKVESAMLQFNKMARAMDINPRWCFANTCRDLLQEMTGLPFDRAASEEERATDE